MFECCYFCSAPLPFHSPNTFAFVLVRKGIRNTLLSSTTEPKQNENEPYKGKSLQPAERERKRERPHSCSAVRSTNWEEREREGWLFGAQVEHKSCVCFVVSAVHVYVFWFVNVCVCVCVSACCRYTADFCNYAFVLLCCYFSLVFFCYTFFSSLVFEHATKFFSFEQLSRAVTFISSL